MKLTIDDLDRAVEIFLQPTRHHELAGHCLALPDWLDPSLDPSSPAFRDQQMRFWSEITRRAEYNPLVDEDTPEIAQLDAVRRPAFYATGDSREAGRHLIAMGHLLLRSDIHAGDRAIEYGAGFGQNALALARLGVKVDTVDVAPGFCNAVRAVAERYAVDLTAHQQPFGFNPAGVPGAYDLILFYESFHHCLEFETIIPQLRDMLSPRGKILMAGEPIVRGSPSILPYPWGIRLDWENVAIMRQRGWMELGFQENFIVRQFANAGMAWRHFADANSDTAQIYEFRRWTEPLELNGCAMTPDEAASWHGAEPGGRWSTAYSFVGIPAHEGAVEVATINFHPQVRTGTIQLGGEKVAFSLAPGEHRTFRFTTSADRANQQLEIACKTSAGGPGDPRQLGLFVERVTPL